MTLTTNAGGSPMLALDRTDTHYTPRSGRSEGRRPERPADRRHVVSERERREPGRFKFSRASALFLPDEAITCPHLHPLPDSTTLLPGAAAVRQCRMHPEAGKHLVGKHLRGGAYCAVWLWIYAHADGSYTVVWIEESEQKAMTEMRMTVAQARSYLGLMWPEKAA